MKKLTKKPLALSTETIRALRDTDLPAVNGGAPSNTYCAKCGSGTACTQ